jgi:hypothetical protein
MRGLQRFKDAISKRKKSKSSFRKHLPVIQGGQTQKASNCDSPGYKKTCSKATKKALLVILFILLATAQAIADDLTFRFGKGDGKQVSAAYAFFLSDFVFLEGQAGLFTPSNVMDTPTLYSQAGIGFSIMTQSGLYLRFLQGFALMRPDSHLNTVWQWPTEFGGGLWFKKNRIGFYWKHFSNGTTSPKNRGREWIGLEVGFSL